MGSGLVVWATRGDGHLVWRSYEASEEAEAKEWAATLHTAGWRVRLMRVVEEWVP